MGIQRDFIENFIDWCGESECPEDYIRWGAISLLAAACGNRIWTTRSIGEQEVTVVPNLYMLLLGPSGNFKSFTLTRIKNIIDRTNHQQIMNVLDGHVTAAGLYDSMNQIQYNEDPKTGKKKKSAWPWLKHVYLLNDELANDVGSIDMADLFIRGMTRLYMGSSFDDRTRSSAHVHIDNYTINWFGLTTIEWLLKSIRRETLTGGFLGRTIMVNAGYSKKRIYRTKRRPNWAMLDQYLVNRIDELFITRGHIGLTKDADRVAEQWYMSREDPEESDDTVGSWRRQFDLSLKLALILSISRHHRKIEEETMVEAQDLTERVVKWQKEVVPDIIRGQQRTNEQRILQLIRDRGTIKRSMLMKYAYDRFNMRTEGLSALVKTFIDAGFIHEIHRPRSQGGVSYVATGK